MWARNIRVFCLTFGEIGGVDVLVLTCSNVVSMLLEGSRVRSSISGFIIGTLLPKKVMCSIKCLHYHCASKATAFIDHHGLFGLIGCAIQAS